MQCKVFSESYSNILEKKVNDFLSSDHYKIIKILQSESIKEGCWSLTITIFYE